MGLCRALDLRHVAAVELEVTRLRERIGNVSPKADRHELVSASPDEQRARAQRRQARPEAIPTPTFRLRRTESFPPQASMASSAFAAILPQTEALPVNDRPGLPCASQSSLGRPPARKNRGRSATSSAASARAPGSPEHPQSRVERSTSAWQPRWSCAQVAARSARSVTLARSSGRPNAAMTAANYWFE